MAMLLIFLENVLLRIIILFWKCLYQNILCFQDLLFYFSARRELGIMKEESKKRLKSLEGIN